MECKRKYNLRECEIVHTRAQLGISNRFYFHHHVEEKVLKFKQFLKDFGIVDKRRLEDMGIFEKFEEIFGDFEK